MKEFDCEQGTEEWWKVRLGIPTASEFHRIITPGQLKPSTQASAYMHKLLAEWVRGKPDEGFTNEWMQRGTEIEEEARDYYGWAHDPVRQVGFVQSELAGCSPDGLVGVEGGLEIKCPSPGILIKWSLLDEMPREHVLQVAGCLLVTGRQWWDFFAYHPDMPPVIHRMYRKEIRNILTALTSELVTFNSRMDALKQELTKRGMKNENAL